MKTLKAKLIFLAGTLLAERDDGVDRGPQPAAEAPLRTARRARLALVGDKRLVEAEPEEVVHSAAWLRRAERVDVLDVARQRLRARRKPHPHWRMVASLLPLRDERDRHQHQRALPNGQQILPSAQAVA